MLGDASPPDAFPLPEMDRRGVDLSQIRAMLARTVGERLDWLEAAQASMIDLRDAFHRTTNSGELARRRP
jgi:hypothetical protein